MKKSFTFAAALAWLALAAFAERPSWIDEPLKYGRETFEGSTADEETKWTYAVGISHLAASESRARARAEEACQTSVATSVAGELTRNLDGTVFSEFVDDDEIPESALVRYEEALNLAVSRFKLPRIEFLEYHTEKVVGDDGRKGFKTYVLGRLLSGKLRDGVEKIDVKKAVRSATKKFEKEEKIDIPDEMEVNVVACIEEERIEYLEALPEL